ncbi:MAG: hypothetical protein ACRDMX_04655 [Solirubrobacteraceae bacterium]
MQQDVKLSPIAESGEPPARSVAPASNVRPARIWTTLAAVALAGALALLIADGDLRVLQADGYKALYDGRWIATHGIPHTDLLSAVHHGRRWVDGEWLGELIYYETWRLGGYPLAALLAGLSIASAYMILAALLRRRGISAGATILLTAYALLGLVDWEFLRAQDLALPLFALLLAICLLDSERPQPGPRLLLLVGVLAVWANIHGSVLLGACLATAYLLWRSATSARSGSRRSAAGCLGLACIAALTPIATPYGPGVVHYYLEFVGNPAQHVLSAEGRSPSFPGGAFFAVYLPLALVACVTIRSIVTRRSAPGLLLAACAITGVGASLRIGNLPWHTIVTALLVAELTRTWLPVRWLPVRWLPVTPPRASRLIAATILAAGIWLLVIASLALRSPRGYEADTPLRVVGAVASGASQHPCWLILADTLDAAALLWHEPQLAGRIAYDARAELFSPATMARWAVFQSGSSPGWTSSISGYQVLVGAVAFRPALVARLARLPGALVIARERRGIAVINGPAVAAATARCGRLAPGAAGAS